MAQRTRSLRCVTSSNWRTPSLTWGQRIDSSCSTALATGSPDRPTPKPPWTRSLASTSSSALSNPRLFVADQVVQGRHVAVTGVSVQRPAHIVDPQPGPDRVGTARLGDRLPARRAWLLDLPRLGPPR